MESSQGITFESINDTPLEFASDEIQALKCLSYAELKLRCRLKGCTFQNSRIDCFKPKENTIIEKLESYFNIKIRANDPLSHSICDKCFEELEVFDMYIKICETAQKIMWATYLNEKNATKNQVVKKILNGDFRSDSRASYSVTPETNTEVTTQKDKSVSKINIKTNNLFISSVTHSTSSNVISNLKENNKSNACPILKRKHESVLSKVSNASAKNESYIKSNSSQSKRQRIDSTNDEIHCIRKESVKEISKTCEISEKNLTSQKTSKIAGYSNSETGISDLSISIEDKQKNKLSNSNRTPSETSNTSNEIDHVNPLIAHVSLPSVQIPNVLDPDYVDSFTDFSNTYVKHIKDHPKFLSWPKDDVKPLFISDKFEKLQKQRRKQSLKVMKSCTVLVQDIFKPNLLRKHKSSDTKNNEICRSEPTNAAERESNPIHPEIFESEYNYSNNHETNPTDSENREISVPTNTEEHEVCASSSIKLCKSKLTKKWKCGPYSKTKVNKKLNNLASQENNAKEKVSENSISTTQQSYNSASDISEKKSEKRESSKKYDLADLDLSDLVFPKSNSEKVKSKKHKKSKHYKKNQADLNRKTKTPSSSDAVKTNCLRNDIETKTCKSGKLRLEKVEKTSEVLMYRKMSTENVNTNDIYVVKSKAGPLSSKTKLKKRKLDIQADSITKRTHNVQVTNFNATDDSSATKVKANTDKMICKEVKEPLEMSSCNDENIDDLDDAIDSFFTDNSEDCADNSDEYLDPFCFKTLETSAKDLETNNCPRRNSMLEQNITSYKILADSEPNCSTHISQDVTKSEENLKHDVVIKSSTHNKHYEQHQKQCLVNRVLPENENSKRKNRTTSISANEPKEKTKNIEASSNTNSYRAYGESIKSTSSTLKKCERKAIRKNNYESSIRFSESASFATSKPSSLLPSNATNIASQDVVSNTKSTFVTLNHQKFNSESDPKINDNLLLTPPINHGDSTNRYSLEQIFSNPTEISPVRRKSLLSSKSKTDSRNELINEYSCKQCAKVFDKNIALQRHIANHSKYHTLHSINVKKENKFNQSKHHNYESPRNIRRQKFDKEKLIIKRAKDQMIKRKIEKQAHLLQQNNNMNSLNNLKHSPKGIEVQPPLVGQQNILNTQKENLGYQGIETSIIKCSSIQKHSENKVKVTSPQFTVNSNSLDVMSKAHQSSSTMVSIDSITDVYTNTVAASDDDFDKLNRISSNKLDTENAETNQNLDVMSKDHQSSNTIISVDSITDIGMNDVIDHVVRSDDDFDTLDRISLNECDTESTETNQNDNHSNLEMFRKNNESTALNLLTPNMNNCKEKENQKTIFIPSMSTGEDRNLILEKNKIVDIDDPVPNSIKMSNDSNKLEKKSNLKSLEKNKHFPAISLTVSSHHTTIQNNSKIDTQLKESTHASEKRSDLVDKIRNIRIQIDLATKLNENSPSNSSLNLKKPETPDLRKLRFVKLHKYTNNPVCVNEINERSKIVDAESDVVEIKEVENDLEEKIDKNKNNISDISKNTINTLKSVQITEKRIEKEIAVSINTEINKVDNTSTAKELDATSMMEGDSNLTNSQETNTTNGNTTNNSKVDEDFVASKTIENRKINITEEVRSQNTKQSEVESITKNTNNQNEQNTLLNLVSNNNTSTESTVFDNPTANNTTVGFVLNQTVRKNAKKNVRHKSFVNRNRKNAKKNVHNYKYSVNWNRQKDLIIDYKKAEIRPEKKISDKLSKIKKQRKIKKSKALVPPYSPNSCESSSINHEKENESYSECCDKSAHKVIAKNMENTELKYEISNQNKIRPILSSKSLTPVKISINKGDMEKNNIIMIDVDENYDIDHNNGMISVDKDSENEVIPSGPNIKQIDLNTDNENVTKKTNIENVTVISSLGYDNDGDDIVDFNVSDKTTEEPEEAKKKIFLLTPEEINAKLFSGKPTSATNYDNLPSISSFEIEESNNEETLNDNLLAEIYRNTDARNLEPSQGQLEEIPNSLCLDQTPLRICESNLNEAHETFRAISLEDQPFHLNSDLNNSSYSPANTLPYKGRLESYQKSPIVTNPPTGQTSSHHSSFSNLQATSISFDAQNSSTYLNNNFSQRDNGDLLLPTQSSLRNIRRISPSSTNLRTANSILPENHNIFYQNDVHRSQDFLQSQQNHLIQSSEHLMQLPRQTQGTQQTHENYGHEHQDSFSQHMSQNENVHTPQTTHQINSHQTYDSGQNNSNTLLEKYLRESSTTLLRLNNGHFI